MAKSTQVAVKGDNDQLPASMSDDFSAYAGAGLETVTAADMLVPRLVVLQALSPQLKRSESSYIPGAEEGMICDVGTGELFPEGVLFLPVLYKKNWLEWVPRKSGGGLANIHDDPSVLDQCQRDEKNRPVMPNGNTISETAQFFGLNLTASRRPCFIPMASTQLKKARKWITLATGEKLKRADGSEFVAPLFYRSYQLTTAQESNSEGTWSGWVVTRGPSLPELDIGIDWRHVLHEAGEFRESLIAGQMKADLRDPVDGDVIEGEGSRM